MIKANYLPGKICENVRTPSRGANIEYAYGGVLYICLVHIYYVYLTITRLYIWVELKTTHELFLKSFLYILLNIHMMAYY